MTEHSEKCQSEFYKPRGDVQNPKDYFKIILKQRKEPISQTGEAETQGHFDVFD